MAVRHLRPMLDPGSSRVFNCAEMTRRVLRQDPEARRFFHTAALNGLVLIKDWVPESERCAGPCPPVGTKLYFPFDPGDIYEGGRTIFLHDPRFASALGANFGLRDAAPEGDLARDLAILKVLDRLPSLDAFLMKDALLRAGLSVNPAYFEISPEQWADIERFIVQRFEPLVKAACPGDAADHKAKRLIEKLWEATDLDALSPLVEALRLPPERALEIFAAWKGVNFYAFQYQRMRPALVALATWLGSLSLPHAGLAPAARRDLEERADTVKRQLRRVWQSAEEVVLEYQEGYDRMFLDRASSTSFLSFLKAGDDKYWTLGRALGKVDHAIYCWNLLTARHPGRRLGGVEQIHQLIAVLDEILWSENRAAAAVAWT